MWTTKELESFRQKADYYLPDRFPEYIGSKWNLKTRLKDLIQDYKLMKVQLDTLERHKKLAEHNRLPWD